MSNSKISYRDLNEWTKGPVPLEIYLSLQDIWKTDIKQPRVQVTTAGFTELFNDKKIVYFATRSTEWMANSLVNHGLCRTIEDALAGMYAEEGTHYIASMLVPRNAEIVGKRRLEAVEKSNPRLFLESVNIATQFEAIGKIGFNEILRQRSAGYSFEKHLQFDKCEDMRKLAEQSENYLRNSLKSFPRKFPSLIVLLEKNERLTNRFIESTLKLYSTAGVKLALDLREKFAGRFPELIRRNLEYDPSVDSIIREYVDLCGDRALFEYLGLAF